MLVFLLAGCTSETLMNGWWSIRGHTLDGRRPDFEGDRISPERIEGENPGMNIVEIGCLDRRELSKWKVGLVAIMVTLALGDL